MGGVPKWQERIKICKKGMRKRRRLGVRRIRFGGELDAHTAGRIPPHSLPPSDCRKGILFSPKRARVGDVPLNERRRRWGDRRWRPLGGEHDVTAPLRRLVPWPLRFSVAGSRGISVGAG